MRRVVSLSLPGPIARRLERLARRLGVPKSLLAREALRRYVLESSLEDLRRRLRPYAIRRGVVTDEDLFARVS
jgi:predicted transcriptional regulator